MKRNPLKIIITTDSNLFIGGAPSTFEIGGIDQCTVLDNEGKPYIPASSFKGAFRAMIKDMITIQDNSNKYIVQIYEDYFKTEEEKITLLHRMDDKVKLDKALQQFLNTKERISLEYLFGIEGVNRSPKLIFSDFHVMNHSLQSEQCFSIDSKNSITEDKEKSTVSSNPRTYKSVIKGITFAGEIDFYNFSNEQSLKIVRDFVKSSLTKFNEGIYRIGNSKSRGYGKIIIDFQDQG
ncbi:hypothetical protein BHU72_05895 [Desulfuribacillus stibiiarsenatis]|uniref:CRISPR type III-associated protein domain-containing protein n=1 Tax=Desulfuribacillus stibiiarsenatis TaxID=1390249 RepID=A0A1E5L4Q4_9FIRM|nr:RAMP superfamily CRISPR-associated protein [Desulfuribacillus stibiiarsenatis]OEH85142.1 hypothetical protein BHU72_05895 [Desulfuribacillus stibiiarsenatis]